MPNYDYKCECGEIYNVFQSMAEPKLKTCKEINTSITQDCKADHKLQRLVGKPMIISDDVGRGVRRMTDKKLYKELDID